MRPRWIAEAVAGAADLAHVADTQHDALVNARETLIDNCLELAGIRCTGERGEHERCKLCPINEVNRALKRYETGIGSGQAPGA